MNNLKNVLILFGGRSTEYHISLLSAAFVLDGFPRDKYNPVPVGIAHEGDWLLYRGSTDKLRDQSWIDDEGNLPVNLSMASGRPGLITADGEYIRIDAAFPILHGSGGEDGSAAGLLDLAGIPCAGCGVGAAAVCMDKYYANCVMDRVGIPHAKWDSFTLAEWRADLGITKRIIDKLGLPVFVKPSNGGSSVGVICAKDETSLAAAIETGFTYNDRVVCEEAIDGMEIEVGVLGDPPRASVCGQVPNTGDLYGYASKYFDGTEVIVPALIPEEKANEIRALAVRAFNALGCRCMTRVDFFIRRGGQVLVNELNTIPGFTSASMYPRMWAAAGVPLAEQIAEIIDEALRRERPKYDFPDPMGE